jgi:tRNA(fMet)-specific endonuclease VapC
VIKYLLDTSICIYINKRRPAQVLERLESINLDEIGISSITRYEMMFGAFKSQQQKRALQELERLCSTFPPIAFDMNAADHAGHIRFLLQKQRTPIGPNDVLLAGQALSLNAILVTNNTREFSRVNGLKLENWAEDSA